MKVLAFSTILFVLGGTNMRGQSEGMTKAQGDEIIRQLQIIAGRLAANTAPSSPVLDSKGPGRRSPGVHMSLGDAPFLGAPEAPLVVVEFTDFQCPYCERFHSGTFRELKVNYIDSGKLRYYSRDLPLDIHPDAMRAAEAGRCANEQGQFWAMHDHMQENPTRLDLGHLVDFAKEVRLDTLSFRRCVEAEKYRKDVEDSAQIATELGARGTPAFLIGRSAQGTVDGELFVGAMSYASFDQRLRAAGQNVAGQNVDPLPAQSRSN